MSKVTPTPRQIEFQDWEFGIFLHFGLRTFYEGFIDFDERKMDASNFIPQNLDCRQWAKTASEAGAKYMVLTAKHHDGFANWPTKLSEFSVKNADWKDGKGDIIDEYTKACREFGLAVGIYYSPFDADCPAYGDPKEYDDFFITQVSELLENYGKIDILWFDGCGSGDHKYDWPRITKEIRRLQPEILIFNMGDPDFRWVGNEHGYAHRKIFNVTDSLDVAIDVACRDSISEARWLPPECDCRLRKKNWFYSDNDENTIKSLPELMGLYQYSVGRGCNLLINIAPNREGVLPEKDTTRILEFGKNIQKLYKNKIAGISDFTRQDNSWTIEFPADKLVDQVVIMEDISKGESVRRYEIFTKMYNQDWVFWDGYNIGHKAICKFPAVSVNNLTLRVTDADGEVTLRSLDLHECAL